MRQIALDVLGVAGIGALAVGAHRLGLGGWLMFGGLSALAVAVLASRPRLP